jgi:hypothetical protein
MAFVATRRQAQIQSRALKSVASNPREVAAYTLDFYNDIPQSELSLDEFEEYALGRLKVIHEVGVTSVIGGMFRGVLFSGKILT